MKLNQLSLTFIAVFASIGFTFGQLTLLSGPEQASYHRFGQDIVSVVEPNMGTPLKNLATSGAAYNFNQLTDPSSPHKIALIQSDYLYYMQAKDYQNNTERTKHIKVLLPLANEEIHFVTKANSGIDSLQMLGGKKSNGEGYSVAIGTQDQGTYATANLIKDRSKVYWTSRNIHFDNALNELHMGTVDAFIIVGSAPIQKLDMNPQAMIDPLAIIPLKDFNGWAKYYDNDTIYTTDYRWLEENVPTFSVKTLLVVNEKKLTDDDKNKIMKLKMGIENNFDELKANGHPKWKEVNLYDWTDEEWPMMK